jgi:hypothetical protein
MPQISDSLVTVSNQLALNHYPVTNVLYTPRTFSVAKPRLEMLDTSILSSSLLLLNSTWLSHVLTRSTSTQCLAVRRCSMLCT